MDENEDVVFEETAEGEAETFSKDKIKKLRDELKEAKAKRDEYLALLQRERADFLNYKKDELERSGKAVGNAQERVLLDLLPALDSYDMAFANKEAWEKVDKNWRMGVEYIHQQILKALGEYSVVPIVTKIGDAFDPNIHQPIDSVDTDEKEKDHTIASIIQAGYKMGDKILRPARVNVWGLIKN